MGCMTVYPFVDFKNSRLFLTSDDLVTSKPRQTQRWVIKYGYTDPLHTLAHREVQMITHAPLTGSGRDPTLTATLGFPPRLTLTFLLK